MGIDAKKIWDDVQENLNLLDSCAGPHAFVSEVPEKPLNSVWRCSKCKGTVRGSNYIWYKRGLEHGRISTSEKT